MPGGSFTLLRELDVDAFMRDLQDVREIPQGLVFLNRLDRVPTSNRQLLAKFIGRLQIADLIATDAKAPVYKAGRFSFEANTPAKLKIGTHFTEDDLEELMNLTDGDAADPEGTLADLMVERVVTQQLVGLEWRLEALAVAMHLDTFGYDRLGFKASGVTWGMPSDLKVTLAVPWTDPVNATPVADVQYRRRLAQERYGIVYDRLTMSTAALMLAVNTAEFQAKARLFLAPNVSYTNLPLNDINFNRTIAQTVWGVARVVLYDGRYWSQDDAGAYTSARFLPNNMVVLDSAANDMNPSVQDLGVGVTMESMLSAELPNDGVGAGAIVGGPDGGRNGPVSYAVVNPALDPPGLTIYSCERAFPRKYLRYANAVMNVGTVADDIPVGEPF